MLKSKVAVPEPPKSAALWGVHCKMGLLASTLTTSPGWPRATACCGPAIGTAGEPWIPTVACITVGDDVDPAPKAEAFARTLESRMMRVAFTPGGSIGIFQFSEFALICVPAKMLG